MKFAVDLSSTQLNAVRVWFVITLPPLPIFREFAGASAGKILIARNFLLENIAHQPTFVCRWETALRSPIAPNPGTPSFPFSALELFTVQTAAVVRPAQTLTLRREGIRNRRIPQHEFGQTIQTGTRRAEPAKSGGPDGSWGADRGGLIAVG